MLLIFVLVVAAAFYYYFFYDKAFGRNVIDIPYSHAVGSAFENYVESVLFPKQYFDLLEKTHDYFTNSDRYVESSKNPDFKFRDKSNGFEFYVEVKFRNSVINDRVIWTNSEQLQRYNNVNKKTPVFICIGCGEPGSPESISLIPLQSANYVGLYLSVLDRYIVDLYRPVNMKRYFSSL